MKSFQAPSRTLYIFWEPGRVFFLSLDLFHSLGNFLETLERFESSSSYCIQNIEALDPTPCFSADFLSQATPALRFKRQTKASAPPGGGLLTRILHDTESPQPSPTLGHRLVAIRPWLPRLKDASRPGRSCLRPSHCSHQGPCHIAVVVQLFYHLVVLPVKSY